MCQLTRGHRELLKYHEVVTDVMNSGGTNYVS